MMPTFVGTISVPVIVMASNDVFVCEIIEARGKGKGNQLAVLVQFLR